MRQKSAELAVALLVVCASGTVNVIAGADGIGSAKALSYLGVYYSVHGPAHLRFVTMLH